MYVGLYVYIYIYIYIYMYVCMYICICVCVCVYVYVCVCVYVCVYSPAGMGGLGLELRESTFLGVPGGVCGGVTPLPLARLSPAHT